MGNDACRASGRTPLQKLRVVKFKSTIFELCETMQKRRPGDPEHKLSGQWLLSGRAPNIDVALKEMVSSEQMESLLTGRIDVGLLRPPISRSEFTTLKVASEHLVAALPFGDARLSQAALSLNDFDGKPLVMYAPEGARYFHDLLAGLFKTAGVTPVTVQSLSQIHSILALVRAGMGAALVPEAAMSLHFDDVHFRPVRTQPERPVELFAAWRTDNDNPALAAFLDLLRADETDGELDAGAASD